jgi:hypothetical protein
MNKDLLQAVISTLEDTRSIRNRISDINAQDSPVHVRLLLRSVFTHCDAVDSIVEEALARSCSVPITMLPVEEGETDDRDLVLSGIVR